MSSELDTLEQYCKERGYKTQRVGPVDFPQIIDMPGRSEVMQDQLIFFDKNYFRIGDAICQYGSYGYKEGLLELMGDSLLTEEELKVDQVVGYLEAEDVIKRLDKIKERLI